MGVPGVMRHRHFGMWLVLALLAAGIALGPPQGPAFGQVEMPDVLIIGDSLAVGTMPYLDALLPDRNLTWDAVDGRTTPQGLQALQVALREIEPQTVVVSLGTNDGPDPRRFTHRIRLMLRDLAPDTCVIWPTIVRPPRKGPYAALNRALHAEAQRDRRLVVLPWDRAVSRGTVVLRDGLHADAAGYRYRSRMIAEAVHAGCPGL